MTTIETEHGAWPEWDTSQHYDFCGACGADVKNTSEGWVHES